MMINKKITTFILYTLQMTFISNTFTLQVQNIDQQQVCQDQNSDTQFYPVDNSSGLHGLITDTLPNDQKHDQSTTGNNTDSQLNLSSYDDTQAHVCTYLPPHKGHDPCNVCACPGNRHNFPCYTQCSGPAHTFELEKKDKASRTCIICGKIAETK